MQISEISKNNLCIDSRKIRKNDIFFDLMSSKNKENPYLKEIIKKKPKKIFSEKKYKLDIFEQKKNIDTFFLKVLKKKFKLMPKNIVGVTGTNGKSSVAYFFKEINKHLGIKCASVGTLGFFVNNKKTSNYLTTPDILTNYIKLNEFYKKKIKNVIIETSSHGLKQGRLNGIKFKTGIFTNFSQDHLDYHKTLKNYLNSKLLLFSSLLSKKGTIISNDKIYKNYLQKYKNKKLLFGNYGNVIKIISIKPIKDSSIVKLNFRNKIIQFKVKLIGKIHIENLIISILAAISVGIKIDSIFNILHKIKNPTGRLDLISKNNKKVIIDYAHTPDGLNEVINNLKSHFKEKIFLIFGCGGDRDKSKRILMGKIANKKCFKVYITDDNPRFENAKLIRLQIAKGCKKAEIISSREKAIKKALKLLKKNQILLIAGKGHENYQIVKNKYLKFSDYSVVKKFI